MTRLRRARGWCLLLPLLLLAAAGCGPGVGGTGTGEGYALEFFGARKASVCSASFAGELKCPARIVVGPAPVEPSEGSELVIWADDPAAARVSVHISASDADLSAHCEGVRFTGTWGETSEGTRRFFGHYTAAGSETAMPGTLTVQTVEGAGLSYVLSDATERVVLGPLVLQRTDKEPTLSLCSSVSPLPLSSAKYR
jgi:hypothetical protein